MCFNRSFNLYESLDFPIHRIMFVFIYIYITDAVFIHPVVKNKHFFMNEHKTRMNKSENISKQNNKIKP